MRRSRRTSNYDLPPLPSDEEVIDAVRALVRQKVEQMATAEARGRSYFVSPRPTANAVAYYLGIQGANRAGNGAVKGSWSGRMSGALRIAPRLRSLAKAGRLSAIHDEHSRWVYDVPGEEWWRRSDA